MINPIDQNIKQKTKSFHRQRKEEWKQRQYAKNKVKIEEKERKEDSKPHFFKKNRTKPPSLKFIFLTILALNSFSFGAATPVDPNGYRPSATRTDFRNVQHNPKLIEHLKNLNQINTNISTLHADHIAIQTFVHEVKYVIEDAEAGIDESCEAIITLQEECKNTESTCQYVSEGIVMNEKTIRKYVQIMNVLQRVCTLEDVPTSEIILARCKRGEHWKTFNPVFEKYGFLNEPKPRYDFEFDHNLGKRAIFTVGLIAISTIIGGLAVAGVTMATENIAKSEANRVMAIEAGFREAQNDHNIINFIKQNNVTIDLANQLDTHEFIATIMARSTNNRFRANDRMTEIKHMFSLDKEWALEDPNTELYQTSIRKFAVEGIRGLTKAEYGEIYRLMSGMSVTKTSVFSEDPNVRTCRSTTVTKTLVIPVIDSLSVTEYESQDGKLIKLNNRPGFYNIIPSEAILSKKTTIFGDTIQVTGRSCEVSNEVETRVEKTGDFLSDILLFKFNGSITLTETCKTSNGVVTSDWVFKDEAYIELPISCGITSEEIKCGSLKLTSSKMTTVEVGPTRMKKITKQNVGERTVRITGKIFRGNFTTPNIFQSQSKIFWGMSLFYWALIGSIAGAVLVLIVIIGICGYKLKKPTRESGLVINAIDVNPGGKFRLGSLRKKKNNTESLEENLPGSVEETDPEKESKRFPELEGVLSIGEQRALANKRTE